MTIKTFVIAVVLVFASVQVAMAQNSNSSPAQTPGPADELETLSQQWMEAAQNHDIARHCKGDLYQHHCRELEESGYASMLATTRVPVSS